MERAQAIAVGAMLCGLALLGVNREGVVQAAPQMASVSLSAAVSHVIFALVLLTGRRCTAQTCSLSVLAASASTRARPIPPPAPMTITRRIRRQPGCVR